MSNWISVKDRLPPEDSDVVAAEFHPGVFGGRPDAFVAWFWKGRFHLNADALEASNYDGSASIQAIVNPTHWMPLPEAPDAD